MKKKKIGSVKLLSCIITAGMLAVFSACGNNDTAASGSQLESSGSQLESSETVENTSEPASENTSETGNGESSVPESTAESSSSMEASGDVEDKMLTTDLLSGQITAIDGQNITLDLAENLEPAEGRGMNRTVTADMEKPEGDAGTQEPAGELKEAETPQVTADGAPENAVRIPEGEAPGGAPQTEFRLTGETRTITVTEETVITLNGEAAVIEDLSVGDKITFVMQDDVVESINAQSGE